MNRAPRLNCYRSIMQTLHDAAPELDAIEDVLVQAAVMGALRNFETEVRQDCLEVILPAGSKIRV